MHTLLVNTVKILVLVLPLARGIKDIAEHFTFDLLWLSFGNELLFHFENRVIIFALISDSCFFELGRSTALSVNMN